MHVKKPHLLGMQIKGMVRTFNEKKPKFIVDTRKTHFPNDRPPLDCHSICGHLIKAYDNATGHPNNSGACDSATKK